MDDLMICIENVSKKYKLGQIGGTTIREELQRRRAKRRGEEDPTSIIGSEDVEYGKEFMALDGISFNVNKGERVGIIGHNGAGKSTLLKLLSRITAPTSGQIGLNGRITSMLEVGTGFHGELTGRENIYMNGAILGMTKKEIDKKIEDIIEFSECSQFIDTPVKRYSSGMYVKLAFAVAAHLDSEIMIMDEVLAVGDMAFQKKCLSKMSEVSQTEGRTILYVSHNMSTIRQLCERVIVLEHGKVIFDGDVEKGIAIYSGNIEDDATEYDFTKREDDPYITAKVKIVKLSLNAETNRISFGSTISFDITYECKDNLNDLHFRFTIITPDRTAVATSMCGILKCKKGSTYTYRFTVDTSQISPGDYQMQMVAFEPDGRGNQIRHDWIPVALQLYINAKGAPLGFEWKSVGWGKHVLPNACFQEVNQ